MNQSELNGLLAQFQATNPSPTELAAFKEGLVYYALRTELSTGDTLQLAIDTMEVDQRDEIEAGIVGLQDFMSAYESNARRRLAGVDWGSD